MSNHSVAVRPLRPGEEEACLRVARSLPEWFNERGLRAMEKDLASSRVLVALEGGRLVGFISYRPGPAAEILWLAVERGGGIGGIGRRLVESAAREAREAGARVLYVKTYGGWDYEPYVATRRFYEALGFALLWVVDPYPGWGDPRRYLRDVPLTIYPWLPLEQHAWGKLLRVPGQARRGRPPGRGGPGA